MKELPSMNELGMSCVLLNPCPNPQELIYYAMHTCYSEEPVALQIQRGDFKDWDERKFGEAVVKYLLNGNRGHFGPLEEGHQFMFAVGGSVHNLVMQLRTHRLATFDVQSQRYTGKRVCEAVEKAVNGIPYKEAFEPVFYLRPVGYYDDRTGGKYYYSEGERLSDLDTIAHLASIYDAKIKAGQSEEHARDSLPQGIRQNFTFSANTRTLLHLDNVRNKPDAQLEIQVLMRHINQIMSEQCPEIYQWQNTKSKKMLSA